MKYVLPVSLVFLSGILYLSCQKNDKNLTHEDFLKIQEAKSYFENNASTLKFFAFEGHNHDGHVVTKGVNESSNLLLDWDNARTIKTASADIVEVPIKMSAPIYGVLYDGFGNSQLNRKQAAVKSSLIIENVHTEGFSYYVLTLCGVQKTSGTQDKYCYSADKTSFSGYEIFSNENGDITKVYGYENGTQRVTNLSPICKSMIDSTGKDIHHKGLQLLGSLGLQTKGGGLPEIGEYPTYINCPNCGAQNFYFDVYCFQCSYYLQTYYGEDWCPMCFHPVSNCVCCSTCHWYPCICEQINYGTCDFCGAIGCTGQCLGEGNIPDQNDPHGQNPAYSFSLGIYPSNAGTAVAIYDYISCTYQLTATANTGYTFAYWANFENVMISTSNPFYIPVSSNIQIVAVFTPN